MKYNIICLTKEDNKNKIIEKYINKNKIIVDCTQIETSLIPTYFDLLIFENLNILVDNPYAIKSLLVNIRQNKLDNKFNFVFNNQIYNEKLGEIFKYYSEPMRFLMNNKEII